MRDVTDTVTGELPGVEQKRGRGRPRKAHAMTNAERQAAFRARRKAQLGSDRSVTVTKKVVEVDAYDDCQEQVDALRFELAEAVAAHNEMSARLDKLVREKEIALREMRAKRDKVEELSRELFQVKRQLLQQKSVTPSNAKSATREQWVELVRVACKGKTHKQVMAVASSAEFKAVVQAYSYLDEPEWFDRIHVAVLGPDCVTRKDVTEKAQPKKVETVVVSQEEWPFPAHRGFFK